MKELLTRVVRKIVIDKEAALVFASFSGLHHVCAYRMECAAGNHAFDDHPGVFGITKEQGHHLRAYFQEGVSRSQIESWIDEALEPLTYRKLNVPVKGISVNKS